MDPFFVRLSEVTLARSFVVNAPGFVSFGFFSLSRISASRSASSIVTSGPVPQSFGGFVTTAEAGAEDAAGAIVGNTLAAALADALLSVLAGSSAFFLSW